MHDACIMHHACIMHACEVGLSSHACGEVAVKWGEVGVKWDEAILREVGVKQSLLNQQNKSAPEYGLPFVSKLCLALFIILQCI